MSINVPKIKDIENKIEIWSIPPYYSKKSKLESMQIDFDANRFDTTVKYSRKISNENYEDIERLTDTFTYLFEIETNYESECFDDKPYIIPYLVSGSKKTVILLSGGGFAYKTFHGGINGGKKVASILNESGISVFLLDYRINPYKFPAAMLDLQRAIRFIKYNSAKFGIDSNNISLLGYSAGGYIVGSFINKFIGKEFFYENYKLDEVDFLSDEIKSAAFVYPCLTFKYNVPMLFAVSEAENVRKEIARIELLESLDLSNHITSKNIPQFITYSNQDNTVDYRGTEKYIKSLKKEKGNITRVFVPNQDHGFDESLFIDDYIKWLLNIN